MTLLKSAGRNMVLFPREHGYRARKSLILVLFLFGEKRWNCPLKIASMGAEPFGAFRTESPQADYRNDNAHLTFVYCNNDPK